MPALQRAHGGPSFPPAPPADRRPESNSLAIVDVSTPAAAKLVGFVRTGISPSGVLATADRVFVSNAGDDSIVEIDAQTHAIVNRITDLAFPAWSNSAA